jgi:HEPN domain-containing protein
MKSGKMMSMAEEKRRTTELVLNGVVVGEMEVAGDFEKDAALSIQFLKDKGLYRKPDAVKTMFRQALSFATTAAHLRTKGLLRRPWNVFDVAPFVVNSAFSIELYLKALARSHGTILKGHDLLKLLSSLPAAAREVINAVLPACRSELGPEGTSDLRTCVAELSNAFVDWRYLHEKMHAGAIRIDRAIFVMKVMDEACRKSIASQAQQS